MPGSTASPQRWPRWRKTASGKERNVPAQWSAAATPIRPGSMWAARPKRRRRRRRRRGKREVRGLLLISTETAAPSHKKKICLLRNMLSAACHADHVFTAAFHKSFVITFFFFKLLWKRTRSPSGAWRKPLLTIQMRCSNWLISLTGCR